MKGFNQNVFSFSYFGSDLIKIRLVFCFKNCLTNGQKKLSQSSRKKNLRSLLHRIRRIKFLAYLLISVQLWSFQIGVSKLAGFYRKNECTKSYTQMQYKVILFPDYVMLWLLLEMLVESVQLRSADFPPKIDLFNLISQKQKSQNTVMRFVLYSSRLLFCSNFTPCFIMETRYVAFWTNIWKQFDSYLLTVKVNTCSDI